MSEDDDKYNDISSLIFDGYITEDLLVSDSYITFKTLSSDDVKNITEKYKYCSNRYNFDQIIEILSKAVKSIGGIEIKDNEKLYKKIFQLNSFTIYFFYRKFSELNERVSKASKLLMEFTKTDESRSRWNIFRKLNDSFSLDSFNKSHQLQIYWFNLNINKDLLEEEKNKWRKVEYTTNTICSFVNPKAYSKVKSQMNITKNFDEDPQEEFNEMEDIAEKEARYRKGKNYVNADKKFIDEIKRKKGESKEDHTERINELMKRQMSGEVIDEHDRIVRTEEIKIFKEKVRDKRGLMLIRKELRRRKKIEQSKDMNEVEVLGDEEKMNQIDEEEKKQGFYCEGTSYFDIVKDKTYMSIPKREKQRIFDELMKEKFDLEKGVEIYLKRLYKNDNKEDQKNIKTQEENTKIIKDNVKSAAEKAVKMNADLIGKQPIIKKEDDDGIDKIVFN